jgi:hypothetical protein
MPPSTSLRCFFLLSFAFSGSPLFAQSVPAQDFAHISTPAFEEAIELAVPGGPGAVITADVNRDGILDLVTVNYSTNSVSVLLGRSDGTFKPAKNYPAGTYPVGLVAADFNGDGILDLAVSRPNGGAINILLGNGDGSFKKPVVYPLGISGSGNALASLTAGDFNGDGIVDLMVGLPPTNEVELLLGKGDGSFQKPTVVAGVRYSNFGTADLNQDGILDLVGAASSATSVFLGKGDGTFTEVATYPGIVEGSLVAFGDFNGDGKLDVAVGSSYFYGSLFQSIAIYMGNGDGTLQLPSYLNTSDGVASLAAIDVDNDGILDLVASGGPDNSVSIYLGHGDGTFAPVAQYLSSGAQATGLALGDFRHRGVPDIVTSDGYTGLTMFRNSGTGKLNGPHEYYLAQDVAGVLSGDFNGDGIPDVLAVVVANPNNGSILVMPGQRNGTVGAPIQTPLAGEVYGTGVAIGDFNGDGKLDVVYTDYPPGIPGTFVATLLGDGDGTFKTGPTLLVNQPYELFSADFNGDGKLDVVVLTYYGSIIVLLGNGDGSFTQGFTTSASPYGIKVGDFNGDGKPDIAYISSSTSIDVLLNHGDGTFTKSPLNTVATAPIGLVAADFNGDGKLDLIVSNWTGVANILLGNGDGTFRSAGTLTIPPSSTTLLAGDLNHDGRQDVIFDANGLLSVFLGNGDGTFQPLLRYGAGGCGTIALIDLAGQGFPDLLTGDCSGVALIVNSFTPEVP